MMASSLALGLCLLAADVAALHAPLKAIRMRAVTARPAASFPCRLAQAPAGGARLAAQGIMMQAEASAGDAAEPAKDAAVPASDDSKSLKETALTGAYFALWYFFNIGYNIYNKKALNVLPMPWTLATLQLFAGIPYVLLLWSTGARKTPKLSQDNLKTLFPVACGHLGTHLSLIHI